MGVAPPQTAPLVFRVFCEISAFLHPFLLACFVVTLATVHQSYGKVQQYEHSLPAAEAVELAEV